MSDKKDQAVSADAPKAAASVSSKSSNKIDAKKHPSRVLDLRKTGYGIGGGYERPYRQKEKIRTDNQEGLYGPIPPSGYYGGGTDEIRFKTGQAGFRNELPWYGPQYGEETSGETKEK